MKQIDRGFLGVLPLLLGLVAAYGYWLAADTRTALRATGIAIIVLLALDGAFTMLGAYLRGERLAPIYYRWLFAVLALAVIVALVVSVLTALLDSPLGVPA